MTRLCRTLLVASTSLSLLACASASAGDGPLDLEPFQLATCAPAYYGTFISSQVPIENESGEPVRVTSVDVIDPSGIELRETAMINVTGVPQEEITPNVRASGIANVPADAAILRSRQAAAGAVVAPGDLWFIVLVFEGAAGSSFDGVRFSYTVDGAQTREYTAEIDLAWTIEEECTI